MNTPIVTRSMPLDDISIDGDGTGRTVTAYATVFDSPVPINDAEGQYEEQIGRTAFAKTLVDRKRPIGVFYNHGATLHGSPSERFSMPLGTCIEATPDGKGLLTRTRYSKTPLADEVLEGIRNGSILGQSFSGRMLQSTPERPISGRYKTTRSGGLVLVTRTEIALTEYGPTPFPAYPDATIDPQIRAQVAANDLNTLDKSLLQVVLKSLTDADNGLDWLVSSLVSADKALDDAQEIISAMIGEPDPDDDEDTAGLDRADFLRLKNFSDALLAARSGMDASTPTGAAAGEPVPDHSRPVLHRHEVSARLLKMGLSSNG